MGAQGTTTIDFGAFPGKTDTSVAVTGQGAIVSGSLVEAWIRPVATADHTADEHMLESLKVIAGNIAAGTGFTIYGFVSGVDGIMMERRSASNNKHTGSRLYGLYTVAWVWN